MLQCAGFRCATCQSMRIAFVNSSREPVRSPAGRVRAGSDADNDLVLSGAGIAARHFAIVEDQRGMVLEVLPGATHVYVNARPVRERGLLRYGDALSVGSCKLLLLPDEADAGKAPPSRPLGAEATARPGFAALRVVSGAWSGRLLPIDQNPTFGGRGSPFTGIAQSCHLQLGTDGLMLDAGDASVLVNGRPRKRAILEAGDQLVIGEHRLVVEAPGLQAEAVAAMQPPPPDPPAAPIAIETPRSRAEFWWLLGTAALVALIIALLLWWKH